MDIYRNSMPTETGRQKCGGCSTQPPLQDGTMAGEIASKLTRRVILGLCTGGILGLIGSCSTPGSDLPALPSDKAAAYRLGPGDRVRLITFGGPELTGEFRVNDSGDIALPLVGIVRAEGLTPRELEGAITDRLVKANLFRDPSVSAEVVEYRPIFILGEVNKPGQYPYQPGMTVVTAVAVAGGFTYRAFQSQFSVVRTTGDQTTEGRAGRETFLQPGDVLTVYERHF
jgi:polysaccharide export outer membrane protein